MRRQQHVGLEKSAQLRRAQALMALALLCAGLAAPGTRASAASFDARQQISGDGAFSVALHLTVEKLTCNENGDPDILLLARFHAQPGGAYHGSHDGILPQ